jgi:branched-chain amino acid transport system substrate-binding protein
VNNRFRIPGVMIAALLVGCVQQSTGVAPAPSGSATASNPKEIVIGALYPLTGPLATVGVDAKAGLDLAVQLINSGSPELGLPLMKDGGGFKNLGGAKLRVVMADTQNDPQVCQSETDRLVTSEKVSAIIGGYSTACILTASQAAERLGVPYVAAEGSSPTLANRGFKWFFHIQPDDTMFSENVFQFLDYVSTKVPGSFNKSVNLLRTDDQFGTDLSKYTNNFAKQYGYSLVTDVAYTQTTPDLTSEILRLKAAPADVLISGQYLPDATLTIKGLKQQGVNFKAIIAHNAFNDTKFIPNLGADSEGLITRESYSADLGATKLLIKQVNDLARAKNGGVDMTGVYARAFTGAFVVSEAINRAASNTAAKLQTALQQTDIKGDAIVLPWTGVKFDAKGQNTLGRGIMLQIQSGKYATVWPPELATKPLIWPLPAWSNR